MSQLDAIDPQSRIPLQALVDAMPGGFNSIADLGTRRATLSGLLAAMTADIPANPNVVWEDRAIPGPDGDDLVLRVYRPSNASSPASAILQIHGGGMVVGDLETEHLSAVTVAETTGAVVVAVDYRLAPEHPAPAAIEDCYTAWTWLNDHSAEFGVDTARAVIMGGSAGGGLAIAVSMLIRDRGAAPARLVMAPYPMIDDRNETASSHEITDVGIWDRSGNIEAWAWYLGGKPADQYSAPARAENLSDLAPTFIDVGTSDLFRDEDIEFANRLMKAGVPCELHVYPGMYHASEVFAPEAELSARVWAARFAALTRALS